MAQLIEGFKEQRTFVVPVSDAIDVTGCFAAVKRVALSFSIGRKGARKEEDEVRRGASSINDNKYGAECEVEPCKSRV